MLISFLFDNIRMVSLSNTGIKRENKMRAMDEKAGKLTDDSHWLILK